MSTLVISVSKRRPGTTHHPGPRHAKLAAIAGDLVPAFRALRRARRSISLAEGEILTRLRTGRTFQDLGEVRFSDFVRERLLLHPRTARRRMMLHRTIRDVPPLEGVFLSGRLDAGRILALKSVATPDNSPYWIHLATQLPLRELEKQVRRARSEADPEETESDRRRIDFLAPQTAGFAIEHGLETAQRVLGWEAPRDACLDAVLSEVASSLPAPPQAPGSEVPEKPARLPPPIPVGTASSRRPARCRTRCLRKNMKRARRVLAMVDRTLERVRRQTPGTLYPPEGEIPFRSENEGWPPGDVSAAHLVQRYRALTRMENPLRALEARLVYHHFDLGMAALHESGEELVAFRELFGISDRSARNLYRAGFAFEHSPALADAYLQGRLGLTHVLALGRAISVETPAWVRRAKEITVRQLRREIRLLDRLHACCHLLAGFGPLPMPRLEEHLRRRLFRLGWTKESLEQELASRGFTSPPDTSLDQAENPVILRRLETLVDILAVETCNPVGGSLPGKTLSVPGRHSRVVVWARPRIWDHWHEMLVAVRGKCGSLPPWAVAVLLVRAALDEWQRTDPDRIPTERRILERDDYRCQAPGCTARKHLEVHHIVYRARGGNDKPGNLVTLCHAHHHHAVHHEALQVAGTAPHALVWQLRGGPMYRGERVFRPDYRPIRGVRGAPASGRLPDLRG